MKKLTISSLLLALFSVFSHGAAITTINIDSASRTISNSNSTPLSGGATATAGDGAVIQIGYYSSATAASPFGNGSFIALTGEGTVFGFATTSIGDTPALLSPGPWDGSFAISGINIQLGINDAILPSAGTPMAIRIFNATTIAASTRIEAISNGVAASWQWQTPATAPNNKTLTLNLDTVGLVAKSGTIVATPGSNVQTNTPFSAAPEPTSATLLMVGLVSLASRRRRAAKV